jgi:predicted DNA-binding transcriptional regulator AlpA
MNNEVHAEWISVAEVQEILGIGRTKAYELVRR